MKYLLFNALFSILFYVDNFVKNKHVDQLYLDTVPCLSFSRMNVTLDRLANEIDQRLSSSKHISQGIWVVYQSGVRGKFLIALIIIVALFPRRGRFSSSADYRAR
jgi:hypothetical protein